MERFVYDLTYDEAIKELDVYHDSLPLIYLWTKQDRIDCEIFVRLIEYQKKKSEEAFRLDSFD